MGEQGRDGGWGVGWGVVNARRAVCQAPALVPQPYPPPLSTAATSCLPISRYKMKQGRMAARPARGGGTQEGFEAQSYRTLLLSLPLQLLARVKHGRTAGEPAGS